MCFNAQYFLCRTFRPRNKGRPFLAFGYVRRGASNYCSRKICSNIHFPTDYANKITEGRPYLFHGILMQFFTDLLVLLSFLESAIKRFFAFQTERSVSGGSIFNFFFQCHDRPLEIGKDVEDSILFPQRKKEEDANKTKVC